MDGARRGKLLSRRSFVRWSVGTATLALSLLVQRRPARASGRARAPAVGPYDGLTYLMGDLHAHSRVSGDAADGEEPADFFYRARTSGLLDFGAITDHVEANWWGPRGRCETGIDTSCGANWETLQQTVAANYAPDDGTTTGPFFTTFLGYEYTHGVQSGVVPRPGLGHRTVLFLGEAPDFALPACADWPDGLPGAWEGSCSAGDWTPDFTALWQLLDAWRAPDPARRDFLTFAHHPYGGAQAYHFDRPGAQQAAYQPLFEIYSKWGSSEVQDGQDLPDLRGAYCLPVNHDPSPLRTARELLLRSLTDLEFRVGFVGGTDSHSTPGPRQGGCGYRRPLQPANVPGLTRFYKGGWTGVWATRNTRTAIWEALKARRCYATTGVRIDLRFAVAPEWGASGLPMGAGWNGSVVLPRGEFPQGVTFRVFADVRAASPQLRIKAVEVLRVRPGMTGSAERAYLATNVNRVTFDSGVVADRQSLGFAGQDLAYYVRVACSNDGLEDDWAWPNVAPTSRWNELAWSSPIWVKLE